MRIIWIKSLPIFLSIICRKRPKKFRSEPNFFSRFVFIKLSGQVFRVFEIFRCMTEKKQTDAHKFCWLLQTHVRFVSRFRKFCVRAMRRKKDTDKDLSSNKYFDNFVFWAKQLSTNVNWLFVPKIKESNSLKQKNANGQTLKDCSANDQNETIKTSRLQNHSYSYILYYGERKAIRNLLTKPGILNSRC